VRENEVEIDREEVEKEEERREEERGAERGVRERRADAELDRRAFIVSDSEVSECTASRPLNARGLQPRE
jgi:hypothetical protein